MPISVPPPDEPFEPRFAKEAKEVRGWQKVLSAGAVLITSVVIAVALGILLVLLLGVLQRAWEWTF